MTRYLPFLKYFHWFKDDPKTCKNIFRLILGSAFQSALIIFLQIINIWIINHFLRDVNALNGAVLAFSVYNIMLFAIYSVNQGSNILIGQMQGVNNEAKIKELFRFKIMYSITVWAIAFIVIKSVGETNLLNLIAGTLVSNKDATVQLTLTDGGIILDWIMWSSLFYLFSLSIYSTLRVHHKIKMCVFGSLLAIVINVILVIALINGFNTGTDLGVRGLGIALLITRSAEFLLLVIYLAIIRPEWIKQWYIPFISKWTFQQGFKFSAFLLITDLTYPVFIVLQQALVARTGNLDLFTALNVVSTALELFFATLTGFYAAAPIYVGAYNSSGQILKSKENAEKIIIVAFIFITVLLLFAVTSFFWYAKLFRVLTPQAAHYTSWFILGSLIGGAIYAYALQMIIILRSRGYLITASLVEEPVNAAVSLPLLYILLNFSSIDYAYSMFMIPIIAGFFIFVVTYLSYRLYKWHKPIPINV